MRMRKKPNLGPRMERCADWWVREPEGMPGRWRDLAPSCKTLWVEVGCGKGRFTVETAAANPDTQARLKALCKTGDGFRIAEEDLQLRGPGDFFGHRQHGLPTFRAANLSMDVSLLQQAQAAAALWIDRHGDADTPEAACLRARVESLFRDGSVAWN